MFENDNAPDLDSIIGNAYDGVQEEASTDTEELDITTDATEEVEEVTNTEEVGEEAETEEPDTDEQSEPTQAITPPQSMSAKDRELFYALPPDQQKWLSERVKQQEADYTRKTMELADQRKSFDRLNQVLEPRKQQLAMAGMDESTAIGQLFALSDFADRDPAGFIQYLANQRGVDLGSLVNGGQQTVNPQLQSLRQELDQTRQFIQQQQFQTQQAQLSEIGKAIDDFSKSPDYPFYSELEQEMVPIVQALKAQNPAASNSDVLAKAYKMAMVANPEVSAKAEADQKAKQEAERIAKAKAEAAKAKKAKGTSVKSVPGQAQKGKPQSMDEYISGLYDDMIAS